MADSNYCWLVRKTYTKYFMQRAYQRNDLARLVIQLMRQLLIICDEICNVDVAVVLFREDVFANLISTGASQFRDPVVANGIRTCT